MPIYEYRCDNCGEVITKLRPVSEYKEPFHGLCTGGDCEGETHSRILSPTPTTFRFNDNKGFKGLDTKRGS